MSTIYDEVDALWNQGLNPTVEVQLVPNDPANSPNLIYVNLNTVNKLDSNVVDSVFIITSSFAGAVQDGNPGYLGTLQANSEGYSSEFWFNEVGKELGIILSDFIKVNGSNYSIVVDVYADVLESKIQSQKVAPKKNTQTKVGGTTCSGTSNLVVCCQTCCVLKMQDCCRSCRS